MSENTTTSNLMANGDRFPSLTALRNAHSEMLTLHREKGNEPEIIAKIEQLINKGRATGALLDSEDDRWAAQSLLDYWNSLLYRAGQEPPDTTLVDFDPSLSPDLSEDYCMSPAQMIWGDQNQVIGQVVDGTVNSGDVYILPTTSYSETVQTPIYYSEFADDDRFPFPFPESPQTRLEKTSKINQAKPFLSWITCRVILPVIIAGWTLRFLSIYTFHSPDPMPMPNTNILTETINVKYSPSKTSILTITERTARLWNLQGKLLSIIGKKGDTLNAVFSPDSKLIATTEIDGNIKLWDYQGRRKVTLNGNKSLITGVAFSPDGKFIAAASSDKNISLWNNQGTLLSVRKDEVTVINLIFSPDGKYILTANKNGIVHRWDLFSQDPNLAF